MMKKTIFIIFIVLLFTNRVYALDELDQFVPEMFPMNVSDEIGNDYSGFAQGDDILINSNFSDIDSSIYQYQILRLASEGIIRKKNNDLFEPKKNITGYELVELLVRLNGNGELIEQQVLDQARGLDEQTVNELYREAFYDQALNSGIILENESIYLNDPVTKEFLAKLIFRVSGLDPEVLNSSEVYSFKDFNSINSSDRGIIQKLLNEKIMTVNEKKEFNPKKQVNKGEAAFIIFQLFDKILNENENSLGLVVDKKNEDIDGIENLVYYIKNPQGQVNRLLIPNEEDRKSENFLVYKKPKKLSYNEILVGDEIKYHIKNDQVYFVDILNDQNIIDEILDYEKSENGAILLMATVEQISEENHNNGDSIIQRHRVRILGHDGNTYDLIIDKDLKTSQSNDFIIYKNGQFISGKDLKKGDQLSLIVKDYELVSYIKVNKNDISYIKGTLRSIDDKSIEIFDYDNKINSYPLLKDYVLDINYRPTTADNLVYGQDIMVMLKGGYVSYIQAETFLNPGYIPDQGKIRMGQVYQKFDSGIVFLLNNGEQEFYRITPDTVMIKEGDNILPHSLKEGDKVKLFFDAIDTIDISKIEVEGNERLIKQVYKGTIQSFNQGDMSILISNPEYLQNTKWKDTGQSMKKIPVDDRVKIYNDDELIENKDLIKRFKYNEAYVVVENSYGNENVVKIAIKNGGEFVMSDQIDSIDSTLERFELDNNQNVNYNKGTIIIKDGRIISHNLLNANDSVLVLNERNNGINTANLIKITSMEDYMFSNVYFGTLKDVNYNSITLDNHTKVEENTFKDIDTSESDEFFCFTETNISDVSDLDDVKELDINDLFHGSYSEDENESEDGEGVDYEKYYTYFITDGNAGIISMKMRFKGLLEDQNFDDNNSSVSKANRDFEETLEDVIFTKGLLTEKISEESRFKITNTHNYIDYRDEWVLNSTDTYFEYNQAIIIKNNKEIDPSDVRVGQYLYTMRVNEKALIIFVEDE